MSIAALAMALAAELQPGDLVSYTYPGQTQVHCLRVQGLFEGVDGQPWVWATSEPDPRRVLRMPVADLVRGCAR